MKRADLKVGMIVALTSASRDRFIAEPRECEVLELAVAPEHRRYGKATGVRVRVQPDPDRGEVHPYDTVVQPARLMTVAEAREGWALRQEARRRSEEYARARRVERDALLGRLTEYGITGAHFVWGRRDGEVSIPVPSIQGHLDWLDDVTREVRTIRVDLDRLVSQERARVESS